MYVTVLFPDIWSYNSVRGIVHSIEYSTSVSLHGVSCSVLFEKEDF